MLMCRQTHQTYTQRGKERDKATHAHSHIILHHINYNMNYVRCKWFVFGTFCAFLGAPAFSLSHSPLKENNIHWNLWTEKSVCVAVIVSQSGRFRPFNLFVSSSFFPSSSFSVCHNFMILYFRHIKMSVMHGFPPHPPSTPSIDMQTNNQTKRQDTTRFSLHYMENDAAQKRTIRSTMYI